MAAFFAVFGLFLGSFIRLCVAAVARGPVAVESTHLHLCRRGLAFSGVDGFWIFLLYAVLRFAGFYIKCVADLFRSWVLPLFENYFLPHGLFMYVLCWWSPTRTA